MGEGKLSCKPASFLQKGRGVLHCRECSRMRKIGREVIDGTNMYLRNTPLGNAGDKKTQWGCTGGGTNNEQSKTAHMAGPNLVCFKNRNLKTQPVKNKFC